MPWHIEEGYESCSGYAVVKDSDGSIAGCHGTEEAAKKQMAALYASEPEARAAKYDHIDFKPPSGVRSEAQKGLDWRSEFGRGGTAIGIARARDLSNGTKISPETARRMKAFFDRHQSDKNAEGWSPGEKGFPSNGRIAHALWGGDAGYAWSRKLVRQMEAAENRGFCPTGQGGGIDNSCSSKGGSAGSGGSDDFGSYPKGYESTPSLTGKGAISGYHGKGGPGPKGATHEVKVDQDGKGGWKYTTHQLGPDGLHPVYDSINNKSGFKTREDALNDATKDLPPINQGAYKASVDGSWKPDTSKRPPNPFSRKPGKPGRPGRLPKPKKRSEAADAARSIREFLEERGFCPTGSGGGIDNSCSSKGGGGGGGGGGKGKGGGKGDTWGDPPARKERDYGDEGYAAAGKKAESLGFKGDTAYEVAHPAHLAVGSTIHVKAPNGAEAYGEVAHIEKSPDGKSYQTVLNSPQRGKDNDMLRPVSIDITPGSEIHSLSGNYTHKKWSPSSGKRIRPSKEKYGPSYLHKKLRSVQLNSRVETRSLCLDDFSDDDAFPLLRVERRCDGDCGKEEAWLVGYAARFGVNSLKMDDFYERIDPGAFSIVTERRGRKSPLETRALFNHDPNYLLGRFPNTLRMKVDEHGLRYEIKMPESRSDLVESIERGDIRGSSFSFVIAPGGEEWSVEEGRSIRTVKSIASLIDVGPVTFPAYPDASVAVARRSYDEFMRAKSAVRRVSEEASLKRREIEAFLRARGR